MARDGTALSQFRRGGESMEAQVVARAQHLAVVDRCTALLAKNSLDNAAALYAYSEHLCQLAPSGAQAYEVITKSYVWTAVNRITGGGK